MASLQPAPTTALLLKQYVRLAQELTDGANPQDNFLALVLQDARYERALQGLRLLARHHVGRLVQTLIDWRTEVNEDIKRTCTQPNGAVNLQGVCKRAAMEILFLEASTQVLVEFVPVFMVDDQFVRFFKSMQQVTFRWLLNAEDYVPYAELAVIRQQVVLASTRVVGAMSAIRLGDISDDFIAKLKERVVAPKNVRGENSTVRGQVLKLCQGMRGVVLSFGSEQQALMSIDFLRKVHPLEHNAPVKKSQVHHALCEMLTEVLMPLVKANQPHASEDSVPPATLLEWYNQVLRMKNDIGQWVNKHTKHIPAGYPLVTVLVCLVDADNYVKLVDSMADFLLKQMKAKEYRSLCIKCLCQLVVSYLVRLCSPGKVHGQQQAWLDRVVKPLMLAARKGGMTAAEQQDFVLEVVDLNPEYAVGSMILDLLQAEQLEAQQVGLKCLYLACLTVPNGTAVPALAARSSRSSTPAPGWASAASPTLRRSGTGGGGHQATKRLAQWSTPEVLALLQEGQHPLELLGISHLLPRLQQQLSAMLGALHRTFSPYTTYGAEGVPRDKAPQLPVLVWVLRLVPFLQPSTWPASKPLDLLSGYTAHAEVQLRAAAVEALVNTLHSNPRQRSAVLLQVVVFLAALPDEAQQTTRDCLSLLKTLMSSWLLLLEQQQLAGGLLADSCGEGSTPEPGCRPTGRAGGSSSSGSGAGLDLHRTEGVLFMLLCSYDPLVRQEALHLLGLVRTLHQQLCRMFGAASAPWGSGNATRLHPFGAAGGASSVDLQGSGGGVSGPGYTTPRALGGQAAASTAAAGAALSPGGASGGATGGSSTPLASGGMGGMVDGLLSMAGNIVDSVASSGSGASLVAGFTRHRATASRDSSEAPLFGSLEVSSGPLTYVMDVLEEVGSKVARQCYWDFGDWSDLWREVNHVQGEVNLQTIMLATDDVGRLRWARVLAELTRLLSPLCPTSMAVAYLETLYQLGRYILRDSAGRWTLPMDNMEGRTEAWKSYVVVACAAPPSLRDRVERAGARRVATGLTIKDIIRLLLSSLPQGPALQQQLLLLALGHASSEHYPLLLEEVGVLMEEYMRPAKAQRRQGRPDEVRVVVANLMRLLCDSMGSSALSSQPLVRARIYEWVRDTYIFLRQISPFRDGFWEVSQVAYCLCSVIRNSAGQLVAALSAPVSKDTPSSAALLQSNSSKSFDSNAPLLGQMRSLRARSGEPAAPPGGAMLRKQLFEMFAAWSREGLDTGAEYAARLSSGMAAALGRLKDLEVEARDTLALELQQSADCLDQAARMAMAALLQGPMFDSDARRAQGPVLFWIDRLLKAPAPVRMNSSRTAAANALSGAAACAAVARNGLFQLLRSNPDMFNVCVDRCYDPDPRVASCYFQVVCEVYSLSSVRVEPHVLLSLVLYKLVDTNPDIREDALHMLHTLSDREWHSSAVAPRGTPKGDPAAAAAAADSAWMVGVQGAGAGGGVGGGRTLVVLGGLQDSYQQFQYQLSEKLARDHPEMSEALCEEVMTRQLEIADKVSQHPMLTGLAPWMENLSIAAHWSGTWCERLLKSMYYVTLRHGSELPQEIERLWSTLAVNKRNIVPMLDFLLGLGMHYAYQQELSAMLEFLSVAKRITLYLARISPQQTIDGLVQELRRQLVEEETGSGGLLGGAPHSEGPVGSDFRTLLQQAAAEAAEQAHSWTPTLDLVSSMSSLWAFTQPSQGAGTPTVGMASTNSSASFRSMDFSDRPSRMSSQLWGPLSASADMTPKEAPLRSLAARSDSGTSRSSMGFIAAGAVGVTGGSEASSSLSAIPGFGLLSSSLPVLRTLGLGRPSAADEGASPPLIASAGATVASMFRRSGTNMTSASDAQQQQQQQQQPGSGTSLGAPLAKIPSYEPSSPALRGLVSRPELALCLLSEVAYEHDEAFSAHLALLLHVIMVVADAEEVLVASHAQQLLVNLLYSLNAHAQEQGRLDAELAAGSQLTDTLIRHLQSMRGRRMWEQDAPGLFPLAALEAPGTRALTQLVMGLVGALAAEPGLGRCWSEVALDWLLHAANRHFAFRSQQVLRALRPTLTQPMLAALLRCLQHACSSALAPDSTCGPGALDAALELLATLRGLVGALPTSRLVLFPSLVWLAVGLLGCNQVQLYCCGVQLLQACLGQLALEDPVVQNVLLAAVPAQDDAVLVPLLAALQPGGGRGQGGGSGAGPAGEDLPGLTSRQQKQGADGEPISAAGERLGHGRGVSTSSLGFQQGVGSSSSSLDSMAAGREQQQVRSSQQLQQQQQQLLLMQQRSSTWLAGLGLPLEVHPPTTSSTNSSISNSSLSSGASPALIAAQQLLLRGLLLPDTCLVTLQLLTQLAGQLAANRHLLLPRLQRPGSPTLAAVMHHRRQLSVMSGFGVPGGGHTVRTLSGWPVGSSPGVGWASPAATPGGGGGADGSSGHLQPAPSPADSLRGAGGVIIDRRASRSPVVRSAAASRGHTGSRVLFRSTGDSSYPASRRSTVTSTISERTGVTRSTPNLGVLGVRRSSNSNSAAAVGAGSEDAAGVANTTEAANSAAAAVSGDVGGGGSSEGAPTGPPAAAAVAPAAAVGWSHRVSIDDTDEELLDSSRTSSARTLQAASRRPLQQQQQQDAGGTLPQEDQQTAAAAAGGQPQGGGGSATGTLSRKKLPPAPFSAAATSSAAAGSTAPASAAPSAPVSAANSRRGGLGWGEAPSSTLRDTLGSWRQRPGSRPVAQALFGEVSAQLVVSGVGLVPLLVAAVGRVPAQDPVMEGLQDAIAVLSAACATHGYNDLASALTQLLAATRATVAGLLATFCRALAESLFPRYSAWVLSQVGALLLLPGAGPQHGAVVQLLQALFEIPGLQLSPEARRLVTDLGVLNPVVVMTKGPNSKAALRALEAVTTYLKVTPALPASASTPSLSAAAAAAAAAAGGGGSNYKAGSTPSAAGGQSLMGASFLDREFSPTAASGVADGDVSASVHGKGRISESREGVLVDPVQQLLPQVRLVEWLELLQKQPAGSAATTGGRPKKQRMMLPFLAGGVAAEVQRGPER